MLYGKLLPQAECSGNPKILIMGYYSSYIYISNPAFHINLYWWNNPDFGGFMCASVQSAVSAVVDSTSSEDPPNGLEVLFG